MASASKKETISKVAPHLPSEIRKKGSTNFTHQWYEVKTIGLAVLFGFFSGFVGGIVVNTKWGEDILWGQNSTVREYFTVSEAERTTLSRETLTKKALDTTVGLYRTNAVSNTTTMPRAEDRIGSAFFLTADGYLATSGQAIRSFGIKDITVVTNDAHTYALESIIFDPSTDLVILKVKGMNFSVLPFINSDRLEPGMFTWTVVPGEGINIAQVAANGVITSSAKDRQLFFSDKPYRFAMLEKSVPAESVGTPLLNSKGEVVGVVVGYKNNRGIIRAGLLKSAFDNVLKNNKITRPSLGVHFYEASQILNTPDGSIYADRGVVLFGDNTRRLLPVERKSPLAVLNLKAGDRILSLNNEAISAVRSLPDIILDYKSGDNVEITYVRNAQEGKITIKLGALNH